MGGNNGEKDVKWKIGFPCVCLHGDVLASRVFFRYEIGSVGARGPGAGMRLMSSEGRVKGGIKECVNAQEG